MLEEIKEGYKRLGFSLVWWNKGNFFSCSIMKEGRLLCRIQTTDETEAVKFAYGKLLLMENRMKNNNNNNNNMVR